jgi:hypothetical protein
LVKTKVGEAPVYYSKVDLEYNKLVLQNNAENDGYFNTRPRLIRSGKKVTAEYTVCKDNIALETFPRIQRYSVQFAKLKTGLC